MSQPDDLLTLREAAALLGLSRQRLQQLTRGRLGPHPVPPAIPSIERPAPPLIRPMIYVRRGDLERWRDEQRRPAGRPRAGETP